MKEEGIQIGDHDINSNDPLDEEIRLVKMTMEKRIESDFGCDIYVARYALAKVDYVGVEEATEYIFGGFDQTVVQHPFFGYTSDQYQPLNFDGEQNINEEKCFVCEQPAFRHEIDSLRSALDIEEG